ncbi:GNAT family N-acetyltransferase [Embleya sp. NBC_00896]|uniref:GNAT family N-acetyltransferase n=1 Tax=Embleya sp. NBC_00896 TaxID=2975961 RepID=UPI003863D215|nr:GNAT family N-acetyltransferase [Embleya sp. NBC_00896]
MSIEVHRGPAAAAFEDETSALYGAVFGQPPYDKTPAEVAANAARFRAQTKKATFRLALARDAGTAVGIAYGYNLSPNTGWWDTLVEAVPEEVRRETGERTFGLIELAVLASYRRAGVGRDLHAAVLRGGTHERVLLNARPDAGPAQALYRSLGYRRVGTAYPWRGAALHDVLLLAPAVPQ